MATSSVGTSRPENDEYWRYIPLYQAALRGDWASAQRFFKGDEGTLTAKIKSFGETTLHIAVGAGRSTSAINFVRNLVDKMPPEALEIVNDFNRTALFNAAWMGNTEVVKILWQKRPSLVYIRDKYGYSPLDMAASNAMKDTLLYLLDVTKNDPFSKLFPVEDSAALLLISVITSGYYDIALYLVEKYPGLAVSKRKSGDCGLKGLARKVSAFKSGSRHQWWQRVIYDRTQEVTKPELEETPQKKRFKKLADKKQPMGTTTAIAGRTRSSTKTSSPDQAESKETAHYAESFPQKEVKKTKTKTAPTKKTQEETVEKTELKKSPSIASSDHSIPSLEVTSEGPPINPEHEASSQTPDKSKVSPFKPDLPTVQKDEVVEEEEADEDMEDFFKTAASLVQVSLSGVSGDGSSSTQVPPAAEEVTEAKETFKALIKMDIRTALHPGRASSFKKALGILARAQVFSEATESTLQNFHKDFPDMQKSYDSAALEISKVESNLTEVEDLRQELSKCVGDYEAFKTQIEAIEKQKTNLTTDIQTREDQIQELKKKQEDAEKNIVALVTQQSGLEVQQKDLFATSKGVKIKLLPLVPNQAGLQTSKERLEAKLNGLAASWDNLRSSLLNEL